MKRLDEFGLTPEQVEAVRAVVYAWKGIIWFGDVEMDADRIRHRVVWSGINKPLAYVPGSDTIAGFQDLDYGERVLKRRAPKTSRR
jgi:hypothetical protein